THVVHGDRAHNDDDHGLQPTQRSGRNGGDHRRCRVYGHDGGEVQHDNRHDVLGDGRWAPQCDLADRSHKRLYQRHGARGHRVVITHVVHGDRAHNDDDHGLQPTQRSGRNGGDHRRCRVYGHDGGEVQHDNRHDVLGDGRWAPQRDRADRSNKRLYERHGARGHRVLITHVVHGDRAHNDDDHGLQPTQRSGRNGGDHRRCRVYGHDGGEVQHDNRHDVLGDGRWAPQCDLADRSHKRLYQRHGARGHRVVITHVVHGDRAHNDDDHGLQPTQRSGRNGGDHHRCRVYGRDGGEVQHDNRHDVHGDGRRAPQRDRADRSHKRLYQRHGAWGHRVFITRVVHGDHASDRSTHHADRRGEPLLLGYRWGHRKLAG